MTNIVTWNEEDLARERAKVSRELGMSIEDAERLAERNALTAEQYAAFRRLQDLAWLAGK